MTGSVRSNEGVGSLTVKSPANVTRCVVYNVNSKRVNTADQNIRTAVHDMRRLTAGVNIRTSVHRPGENILYKVFAFTPNNNYGTSQPVNNVMTPVANLSLLSNRDLLASVW